jgi:hypothetical protein
MANEFIARRGLIVLSNGATVTGSLTTQGNINAGNFSVTASAFTGSFTGSISASVVGSLTGNASTATALQTTRTLWGQSFNGTTSVSGNLDNVGNITGTGPITVSAPSGDLTLATPGGSVGISSTTNSTTFNNGALIVQGGVGIARDVNISGSLRVTGLLTAASMSTQYVTSSQYSVGVSKIILNDDDNVRFAGISIYDSGSTNATASIFWDSQNHHFIYQNEGIDSYTGGMFIAGPRNTGALGNEEGMVFGRVPVGTDNDHIDNRLASSSIRVEFPSRLTHIEAGLYVTGAITSSVGFAGDGSGLTNIAANLNVTGSQGGTSTVALRTQALIVSGTNGIAVTATGQTITISGSNATTTTHGVAAFTGSNFTVNGGIVSSNPINFNGSNINLGGTHTFGLQNITPYGASTSDQVTLSGGAIISNVLHSSATVSNIVGPVTNQVIASITTGSYDAARYEYVVKDGTNFRTGTVMAVWRGGAIEYTDTSTNDIGNTAQATFDVDTTTAGLARLKFNVTSGTWTVKTIVNAF